MIQNDNFDLSKFLRNNSLLKEAFEGFNGYKDLEPVKEEDQVEEAAAGMYYADLDSADFYDEDFQAYLKANKIKTKIVDPEGPAGHAPIVRYIASKETLRDMISKSWANDPSTARGWYNEIKPLQKR